MFCPVVPISTHCRCPVVTWFGSPLYHSSLATTSLLLRINQWDAILGLARSNPIIPVLIPWNNDKCSLMSFCTIIEHTLYMYEYWAFINSCHADGWIVFELNYEQGHIYIYYLLLREQCWLFVKNNGFRVKLPWIEGKICLFWWKMIPILG